MLHWKVILEKTAYNPLINIVWEVIFILRTFLQLFLRICYIMFINEYHHNPIFVFLQHFLGNFIIFGWYFGLLLFFFFNFLILLLLLLVIILTIIFLYFLFLRLFILIWKWVLILLLLCYDSRNFIYRTIHV